MPTLELRTKSGDGLLESEIKLYLSHCQSRSHRQSRLTASSHTAGQKAGQVFFEGADYALYTDMPADGAERARCARRGLLTDAEPCPYHSGSV